ncbi:unnamed protein product [Gadus morhua 'NCC']
MSKTLALKDDLSKMTASLPDAIVKPQQIALHPASLYNTMMIAQQGASHLVQLTTSLSQNTSSSASTSFPDERSGQMRFPAGQQLLTKLLTGQVACGLLMLPTNMFMGQLVTAFAPQQGQAHTMVSPSSGRRRSIRAHRLLHGNQ